MDSAPVLLYQDNAITRARFDLSAMEMNIFFHVLKQIRIESKSTFIYQVNVRDIIDDPDSGKRSTNHAQIRRATKKLISKVIDIPLEGNDYIQSALISAAQYQNGAGRILIQVSEPIKPYLLDIAKNTTRYYFQVAIKLKSVYSKRFYQFISQWKVKGDWKVTIQELRERLQLQNSYRNYGDFKINVINPAMEELMMHADYFFTYEEIKDGKRVDAIHIKVIPNKRHVLNQTRIDTAERIDTEAKLNFPIDANGLRNILEKELQLSPWQVMNVLATFNENQKDLWAAIYQIRTTPTVKSVGAKAWSIFTKKYDVPDRKIPMKQ